MRAKQNNLTIKCMAIIHFISRACPVYSLGSHPCVESSVGQRISNQNLNALYWSAQHPEPQTQSLLSFHEALCPMRNKKEAHMKSAQCNFRVKTQTAKFLVLKKSSSWRSM
eukprot:scaffold17960_cov15-Tisochrysis_lutea.AAC.1